MRETGLHETHQASKARLQLNAAGRARRRPTTAAVTDQQQVLTMLTPLVVVLLYIRFAYEQSF
jgi:hypothetical protein